MANKNNIEAAIEDRLIKALDEDLDADALKSLHSKVTAIRALAGDE